MPRKRPFSAKQKKKQLQDKRERKRGLPDGVRSSSNSRSGSHERREDQTDTSDSESLSLHVRKLNQQPAVRRLGERSYDPNRYRLHFERESREELERRKKVAQEKILEPVPESEKELDIQDVYRSGSVLDFPKRPPWSYQMSKEQLLLREEKCFRDYLEGIYSTYQPSQLSYFEHNLETWRQLWRVLEMSDIILLITDVRHQVINFSPALYDFVTKEMRKNLILVLNKIDLAPPGLVVAWKYYFQTRFPQVHIVCFTSYPQQSQDPSTVFKKRRKRRKGRSTAMGPEQLLHACETITAGKVDLNSWKEKIERDAASAHLPAEVSDEEDDDDEGAAVLVEHQTDVAMDVGVPSQELYKDGVLTVGCVGFPNVGKSSLMNGLVGHKVVSVSRTPGHTKYFQTYFLTPTVRLCDCPGLIFPSLVHRELQILSGIYPISQIQEPYNAVGYLASRIPIQALLKLRHPNTEEGKPETRWCAWDICEAWAEKRGYKTAKAARNDVYRAANSILRLAGEGRLCLCLRPPGYSTQKGPAPVCVFPLRDPSVKRTICKSCSSLLVPGVSSTVRQRRHRGRRWSVVRCLCCGQTKRFPSNPGYKLWAEQPEALLENQPKAGPNDDGTAVLTTSGPIRGKHLPAGSSTVTAFLGIPYAEPYHVACPIAKMAGQMAEAGGPVYVYSFTRHPRGLSFPKWMGVPHGSEVPYLFGMLASMEGANHTHTEAEVALSRRMMRYWAERQRVLWHLID
ncbi:Guanine nucleotide-binding protein-like 1 [Chelonia mydas]|uniref:Guanine nucleotide-binding protein-like 1 n=1 Tax=Chelonia mydas TaxID=8469 RepID=M7B6S5_CHEMY|nr:Guanine nucleotide-binding protein-like 1 [Chelonia mydas]